MALKLRTVLPKLRYNKTPSSSSNITTLFAVTPSFLNTRTFSNMLDKNDCRDLRNSFRLREFNDVFHHMDNTLSSFGMPYIFKNSFFRPDKWENEFWNTVDKEISPAVDITESENDIMLHVEIPGVKKEDIKIELDSNENLVTISGERKSEIDEKSTERKRSEIKFGSFQRTITLPDGMIDASKVKAKFENGILELKIGKPEKLKDNKTTINID